MNALCQAPGCCRVFRRHSVNDSNRCHRCRPKLYPCVVCDRPRVKSEGWRCTACVDAGLVPMHAGALIDGHTRYEDDVACQLFVAHFSGGATLEEVGEALGVTRERVRQIEESAIRRLRARMTLVGIDVEDMAKKPAHPLAGGG